MYSRIIKFSLLNKFIALRTHKARGSCWLHVYFLLIIVLINLEIIFSLCIPIRKFVVTGTALFEPILYVPSKLFLSHHFNILL